MFARIVEFVATSEAAAEFVRILHEKVLPRVKAHAGCVDAFVELPNGGAVLMGVSLWESREDAEQFRQHCYPEIECMLLPFLKSKPTVRTIQTPDLGKIVVHARALANKAAHGPVSLR